MASIMTANVPDWDAPVCPPGVKNAACTTCEPYKGALNSDQVAPSCFKMYRAFARGLRRYYIDASERLLAGPMQSCRIDAKLERWTAALKPFMERDTQLGLFPELGMMKLMAPGQTFADFAADFKNSVVPGYISDFKSAVKCSATTDANADLWGDVIDEPVIGAMMDVADEEYDGIKTLPEHPHWVAPTSAPAPAPAPAADSGAAGVSWLNATTTAAAVVFALLIAAL